MTLVFRLLKWIGALALGAAAILLVMALGVILFVALTPVGGRVAADRISAIVSTPDRIVTMSPPEGLLTGDLRIGALTLSDEAGTYAEIDGIKVDWSPKALVNGVFHAERISAENINFLRAPSPTAPAKPKPASQSGFSLPMAIKVDEIAFPDINLSQALSGRDFDISIRGSIDAGGPNIALDLEATRKDEPNAKAIADVLYAPAENQLRVKASVSEPQGGLLARLLRLPGAPAVELALDGSGPLSDWAGKLNGSVGGTPVIAVDGRHTLEGNGAHRVVVTGGGQLSTLLPPAFRPLFDGTTDIDVSALYSKSGRVDIQRGDLTSGAVRITAKGAWDPAGDNSLTASLAGTNGPVDFIWPISGRESRFSFETINFTLTGAATSARFNATAALSAAEVPQGRFGQIRLQAESEDLNLVQRSGSVRSRLTVGQSHFNDPEIDRVVRAPVTLDAPIRLAPPAIGLDAATFESAGVSGTISGAYDQSKQGVTGNFRVFADPSVLPPSIAPKFEGKVAAEGYVNATAGGRVSLENIVLKSNAVEAHGTVLIENETISGRLAGRVPELKRWLADAEGAAGFDVSAEGPIGAPTVKAIVNSAEARLVGRLLEDLSVTVNGTANPEAPVGQIAATGTLDGQPIRVNADVSSANGRTAAPDITAEIGPNRLTGSLTFSPEMLPEGTLSFEFPDVALLAALAAQQAQGDLKGTVTLSNTGGRAGAVVRASGTTLARGNITIAEPVVDLAVPDIKALAAEGTIRAARIGTGAFALTDTNLGLTHGGGITRFNLAANYDNAPVNAVGSLQTGDEILVALDSFSARPRNIPVRLANPTRIVIADGNARLSGLTISTGNGNVTVDGTAGSTLQLNARINSLPANLINTFVPAINAAGTISGTIDATGSASAPSIRYDLEWSDAQFRQTRDAGVAPFQLRASGRFENGTVALEDTRLSGAGGLDLSATGRVILNKDGAPALDLNADARSVPASLVNAFVPGLEARGTINGKVTATGTPDAPAVRYDLTWTNAGVRQTTEVGLSSLQVTARGTFQDGRVTLDTQLSGQGLSLAGGGSVSLSGQKALDLNFEGQLPFSILAAQLASQGFVLEGNARLNLAIRGTTAAPAITGNAAASGARLIDVRRNLAINNLAANVSFDGNRANISNLGGTLSTGGRVAVEGSLGILPASGFPADLRIILEQATYVDGSLVAATADGTLTLTGPLTSGPVLGGRLTLTKAAVTVPAKLPTSLTEIDIRHRNAPPDVLRQIEEIRPKEAQGSSRPIRLDLQIQAPNGIFVRGRGIDAELGGELTVRGTAIAPEVSGGFEMRRGRIVILTKRLDFTEGDITFGGGLIPVLNMEASTTSAQTTVTVSVTGIANDPNISFSSSPALPQDEVLARLIFGQSMSRLSPVQIAQLADAVSQLAGGGSNSLFETLRSNLGVDDLDIGTDDAGRTTVSVGRYINNRTYFQVEQGGAGGARATINLDVGRGVKLKAGAGTQGGTAGIFYEREY